MTMIFRLMRGRMRTSWVAKFDDSRRLQRAGASLVELLVAATLGLVVMAALATLFGTFGRTVSQSQSLVDLSTRIRVAASRLRQDLHGTTAPVQPWVRPEANAGYFEVVEGPVNQSTVGSLGDCDDRLHLTTTAFGTPFTGQMQGSTATEVFESRFAEVNWFCEPSGNTFEGRPLYTLYRRQFVVSATPGAGRFDTGVTASIDRNLTDLACRPATGGQQASSLADLSKVGNRFWPQFRRDKPLQGERSGEDVLLNNVIAFDVQVFDQSATPADYTDRSFNTYYLDTATPITGDRLRGLQVRIRCVEPYLKQIRQVTVVHTFKGL